MRVPGSFMSALGGFFGGYAQDEEAQRQRQRQAGLDAQNAQSFGMQQQLHGAQMQNIQSEIAARETPHAPTPQRHYDPARGGIVDELAGTFTPIPGLPGAQQTPHQPTRWEGANGYTEIGADGQPKFVPYPKGFQKNSPKTDTKWQLQQSGNGFVWANPETREIMPAMMDGKVVFPKSGTTASENPQIASTRRDLQGFQSQQIRAEHDVTAAKADLRALPHRAALPLSQQRTAADSAQANNYASATTSLADAEKRKGRLTHSADSTQNVLTQLRTASPPAAEGAGQAGSTSAPRSSSDWVQRAKDEEAGFKSALQQIDAAFQDPAQRLQKKREAMQIYNTRMVSINAGRDPDTP